MTIDPSTGRHVGWAEPNAGNTCKYHGEDLKYHGEDLPDFPVSSFLVLDTEIHTPDKCRPDAYGDGSLLLVGELYGDSSSTKVLRTGCPGNMHALLGPTGDPPKILVGHNIKFDIQWLLATESRYAWKILGEGSGGDVTFKEWLAENMVWDTMVAEYILTGQRIQMASLAELAQKYCAPQKKSDVLSEHFANGGKTIAELEPKIVAEYLESDLLATYHVARVQIELAQEKGLLKLCLVQMGALLGITDMEHNGLYVSLDRARDIDGQLAGSNDNAEALLLTQAYKLAKSYNELDKLAVPNFEPFSGIAMVVGWGWSPASNHDVTLILFGGKKVYKEKVANGFTKTGKPKLKTVEHKLELAGVYKNVRETWLTDKGKPSVSDEVIEDMLHSATDKDVISFLGTLREYREYSKLRNTYLTGLTSKVQANSLIHHKLNQCITSTGRLSSSDPNLQNIPSFDKFGIKTMFCSRFPEGYIVEADFKQIEVVALAYLSRDPVLCEDIRMGRDIHAETGKSVFGDTMDKEQRRIVKTINFGLIYGGGASTLARQAHVSETVAKDCIMAFYGRYEVVAKWFVKQHQHVNDVVKELGAVCGHSPKGIPIKGKQVMMLPTGRSFYFTQSDVPTYGTRVLQNQVNVKPSVVRNYPIQGFATGDIVPMVISNLWRQIALDPDILMVNTVHDSIMFDCRTEEAARRCAALVKTTIEATPKLLNNCFGINDFDLPVRCEVSMGKDWGTLTEI